MTQAELLGWLVDWIAAAIGTDPASVDVDARLDELGLASRDAVALSGDLEDVLDRVVAPTLAWEFPSLRALAAGLLPADVDPGTAPVRAEAAAASTRASIRPDPSARAESVAVIGVGCRLPGNVQGPDDLWSLLLAGGDAIGKVPDGRWASTGTEEQGVSVPHLGGFLEEVAGFDAEFFGISPHEADLMDPQQRLLLEVTLEALQHARLDPAQLRGTETGVYIGISSSEYAHLTTASLAAVEPWTATGAALSIAANRVSYFLDLHGPSLAVDTACSSSLVALHQACGSLLSGETDAALVGGVNLLLTPVITASFDRAGVLAADGRCKSFGADADGIGRAEGCGVIVLKRLSDAVAEGDRVLAVVAGSAVNSDGRSNGLAAPNPAAQEAVLRRAYAGTGIDPATVDYVEAHGTGTLLGDPIEAAALGKVLGVGRPAESPLLLGSIKSNLGHLEAAAGIAAVIKVVLSLAHDRLPASLHADAPNPHLDLDRDHLRIQSDASDWPRYAGVARAGVSGFGFGGTNAHVILEQAPPAEPAQASAGADARVDVLALSAGSDTRLVAAAGELADWLELGAGSDADLAVVARSLARQRADGTARIALVGTDRAALATGLRQVQQGAVRTAADRPVWVFSGYGQQWAGMGRGLLATEPVFAAAVEEAQLALAAYLPIDVPALLAAGTAPAGVAETMATIFAVQMGLAALWRSLGVEPAAVIGHSLGEVAAAVVAGGLGLVDGARVIAVRALLLEGIDTGGAGAMCVVDVGADDIRARHGEFPDVEIAVDSSPVQCTVAGPRDQVDRLAAQLEATGHDVWPLRVSGAGHSAAVEPVLEELLAQLADVRGEVPLIPVYGTVLADPREVPAFDAAYWAMNARRTVRFAPAVSAARADGFDTFLEISAHPVAARALVATLAGSGSSTVVGTLRRDGDDGVELARAVGVLHAAGHPTVLAARYPAGSETDLPSTPWLHLPYWFVAPHAEPGAPVATGAPDLGQPVELPGGTGCLWTFRRSDVLLAPYASGGSRPRLGVLAVAAIATEAARVALRTDGAGVELTSVALQRDGTLPDRAALLVTVTVVGDGRVEVGVHGRESGTEAPWVLAASATAVRATEVTVIDLTLGSDPHLAAPLGADDAADHSVDGVRDTLRVALAEILGHAPEAIDPTVPMTALGLDSLMAVRAQHAVDRDFGLPLPVRLLLQGLSLDGLAEHLAHQLAGRDGVAPQVIRIPEQVSTPARAAREVDPRDPCERFVAQVWGAALDDEPRGVTARLSQVGDRDAAARLARALGERLERVPSVLALWAADSLEHIADLVRPEFEGDSSSLVRTLRAGHARRPLFLFHPAGGPTNVYRPLVDLLDPEQPVYGLERLADVHTVEGKAAQYVEMIRERQPAGPYRLMGWSLGGLLANEVAQQFVASGEQVELLACVDTILPHLGDSDEESMLVERYQRFAEHISDVYGADVVLPADIGDHDEPTQMQMVGAALDQAGVVLPAGILLHQYTSYVDSRIAERYTLRPWHDRQVLYRAQQADALTTNLDPRYLRSDTALGWDATVDDLVVVPVPGSHITMIDRPNVDVIAADLTRRLDALDRLTDRDPAVVGAG